MKYHLVGITPLLGLVAVAWGSPVCGAPDVPEFVVETYATVTRPSQISFDPGGVLYTGNDTNVPNYPPVKVHRIGIGGYPVEEYGHSGLTDPDAVVLDPLGSITGIPGDVLVGSSITTNWAQIGVIHPDQSVQILWGPTSVLDNPNVLLLDSTKRLLILDQGEIGVGVGKILASRGAFPTVLFVDGINLVAMTIDRQDRIYTSDRTGTIAIHASDGTLLNNALVTGLGSTPMLFWGAYDSAWGDFLYTTDSTTGELLRVDTDGAVHVVGTGFQGAGYTTLGPDGSLYVTFIGTDQIWRIRTDPSSVVAQAPANKWCEFVGSTLRSPAGPISLLLTLSDPQCAQIGVYDVLGRALWAITTDPLSTGAHSLRYVPNANGRPLPCGIYFVRVAVGGLQAHRRLLILK